MQRMMIYIVGREWSSKCWLPGPSDDPGEELEVLAPRPGDQGQSRRQPSQISGEHPLLHRQPCNSAWHPEIKLGAPEVGAPAAMFYP